MSTQLFALTHGANGLRFGFALVLVSMLVGVRHGRAPRIAYLRAVLLSVPATVGAGISICIERLLLGIDANGTLQLFLGTFISIGGGYSVGRWIAARKGDPGNQHRRGAVVTAAPVFADNRGASSDPNAPVTLAGFPVPLQDETKHFKLIGTTGTGKSTAIRELLSTALARGDRAVIADPDAGYLDTFYDAGRGDVILNPFSAAGAKWSLLGEVANEYDIDQLARSFIPNSSDPDQSWIEYSRTFLGAAIRQCVAGKARRSGNGKIVDDNELYRLVERAPVEELRMILGATAAGPFLDKATARMFGCVRAITTSAVKALKYTARQEGTPFSVKEWVGKGAARNAGGKGGVLFLPYKAGEIASLRSTISAWLRLAIFEAMNKPEGDQRLWFIIDELDALGEIDGLKDALMRLRKFGGRCALGLQSIALVGGTYGKGASEAIVENCGTTVILRCSASEHGGTSEFASNLIGQREVAYTSQAHTRRRGRWFNYSTTTSEQVKLEPAVLASEIERLPDLEGFLKLASNPDWQKVRLTPDSFRGARGKTPSNYGSPPDVTIVEDPPVSVAPAARAEPTYQRMRKPRRRAANSDGGTPPASAAGSG